MTCNFGDSGFTDVAGTPRNVFELTYNGITITFPAPLLGDREEKTVETIKRELVDRRFVVYKPPEWDERRVVRYQFSDLEREVSEAYLAFIDLSLGQPVTVTDHFSRTWTGIIMEPEASVGRFGPDDSCKDTTEVVLRWL